MENVLDNFANIKPLTALEEKVVVMSLGERISCAISSVKSKERSGQVVLTEISYIKTQFVSLQAELLSVKEDLDQQYAFVVPRSRRLHVNQQVVLSLLNQMQQKPKSNPLHRFY